MGRRKKRAGKPRGKAGFVRISFGPDGADLTRHPNDLPAKKEEIELAIATDFLASRALKELMTITPESLVQNPQDDFDFSIRTADGELRYLELMEIAPIKQTHGYDAFPPVMPAYPFAEFIFSKIEQKSDRYRSASHIPILLLLYSTDWKFTLVPPALNMVQVWLQRTPTIFEAVFYYKPIAPGEGLSEILFPTDPESLSGFDPEVFRGFTMLLFDPMSLQVERPPAVEGRPDPP